MKTAVITGGNSGIGKAVVSAPLFKGATIFFDDIAMKNNFTMMKAMVQEMFANHLFTQEFAKRNPGNDVVMNIGHTGISKTGIMRETNFFLGSWSIPSAPPPKGREKFRLACHQ